MLVFIDESGNPARGDGCPESRISFTRNSRTRDEIRPLHQRQGLGIYIVCFDSSFCYYRYFHRMNKLCLEPSLLDLFVDELPNASRFGNELGILEFFQESIGFFVCVPEPLVAKDSIGYI